MEKFSSLKNKEASCSSWEEIKTIFVFADHSIAEQKKN
jgi:hypothetical protein